MAPQIKVGDNVQKVEGYPFPGQVRAIFQNLAGEWRVVVECTAEAVAGCMHIYNLKQIMFVSSRVRPDVELAARALTKAHYQGRFGLTQPDLVDKNTGSSSSWMMYTDDALDLLKAIEECRGR